MKRFHITTLAVGLSLLTDGCAAIAEAPAGSLTVAAGYSVTLEQPWNDVSKVMPARPGKVRVLSLDGPLLNRLYLTAGLAPGEALVAAASKDKPTPAYRTGMSPTELVELVADSLAAMGYQRVETSNLSPATFSGSDALRFDLSAKTKEGLNISARAQVAERSGKLFLIVYIAPTEHYYAAGLPAAERIMASAHLG